MRFYVFDTRHAGSDYIFATRFEWLAWIVRHFAGRHFDYWHTPEGI